MVPVIPAILVIHIVDAVEYTAEVSFRIALINKTMLCPVAHHHDKTRIDHRNDKDHEGSLEIDKTHGHAKQVKG